MEQAKKMVLVDCRVFEKLQESMREKTLNKLDSNIEEVLRRDLPDDEKAKIYSASLNKYLALKDEPVNLPSSSSSSSPPPLQKLFQESDILQSVPMNMRGKASKLVEHISRNPSIGWSDRGELIYNDRVVPDSHAVDLVNDLLRKKNAKEPVGWDVLARALKESNVPRRLIDNDIRWDRMHSTPDRPIRLLDPDTAAPPSKRPIRRPLRILDLETASPNRVLRRQLGIPWAKY